MKKPKPRRPRRPRIAVQPSITEQIAERTQTWRNIAITLSAIGAVLIGLWSGIVRFGWDPVLAGAFAEYKVEMDRKVIASDEVIKRDFQSKIDEQSIKINGAVMLVQQDVALVRREVRRFQIENLEAQEAQVIWSQMPQLVANLAGIERQLIERQGDATLLGRQNEVKNAIKNVEDRLASIRSRLKTLREQL